MNDREVVTYCIETLLKTGADKCQCELSKSKKYEMNVESGSVSLLRTTLDTSLGLTVIKDKKKGFISINKADKESIDEAVNSVFELCRNSEADDGYDIAPLQDPEQFTSGIMEPDLDRMYTLLTNFVSEVSAKFPTIKLNDTILTFNQSSKYVGNSNGVDFSMNKGIYDFMTMFASKDGEKGSSFNYSGFFTKELDKELLDCGTIEILMRQNTEQITTRPIEGKFQGDVIITPDCLNDLISAYVGTFLTDSVLISGTSLLKDKLNEQISSPLLTLSSKPVSPEICDGYFVTGDGFKAENVTILEKGVLKSFLLSQYGANKTGLERAKNSGYCYVVEPGDTSFEEMVKNTAKGILVARFSGGMPSTSGDFSGVAKNSYYIENGEIKYPVSETMISGNLLELFRNIKAISSERVDFGAMLLPHISSTGVTVSGK
ncbi:MAG: TldD/PmbA family protein [Bacillota bacterium]|nr:TldD/PmbA family protein [Bacillota bacterium]